MARPSNRNCSISANHDERGCGRWWGNDPICEFQKAAQNKIYEADAALRKVDCERLKVQDKASCELEMEGEKKLCELGKGVISAIHQSGNFANLDLDANARSEGLNVCLRQLRLDSELKNLNLAVDG